VHLDERVRHFVEIRAFATLSDPPITLGSLCLAHCASIEGSEAQLHPAKAFDPVRHPHCEMLGKAFPVRRQRLIKHRY
jgi:hypothetical protein